jgi:acetyl-CoA acetyltransferase
MSGHALRRHPTIAGLGITSLGRAYEQSATGYAADAIRLAAEDAGLQLSDIDGLLLSSGIAGGVNLDLQAGLGLRDLRLLSEQNGFGSTAAAMVQVASMAIEAGTAEVVACVYADAPLRPGPRTGAYGADKSGNSGWRGLLAASGAVGATPLYALAARRHMLAYGTTSDQLGAVAVAQRDWAVLNPRAQMRQAITLQDYLDSRWIAEPLRLLDCCLVTNGGIAVIVTSSERAASLRQRGVEVLGWGQGHPGTTQRRDDNFGLRTGAAISGPAALGMAGVRLTDIDLVELYDCYTYTVLVTLEDYGFCAKGEGGEFVSSGVLGPSGSLKLNTGGGQLSSYYLWGMTPLSEAILQLRGGEGERQVPNHRLALVSGNGGVLSYHASLVLAAQ